MRLNEDKPAIEQLDQWWLRKGRESAPVYSARKDWLYRRVESIEFVGRSSVQRRVSVDLEIPKCLPVLGDRGPEHHLVPISVFQKWPPLMGFSLVGPEGHPVSLYTRDTNVALDFGLLLGLIDLVCHKARFPNVPDRVCREPTAEAAALTR